MPQGATLMAEPEITETRGRARFNLRTELEAQFVGQPAIVRNLSAQGMGLRHAAQVRVGSSVTVRIDAPENDSATQIRCRVVWSRLSRMADEHGKHLYDSGLLILDDAPAVGGLLGRLIRAYGVKDTESLEAKRRMLAARKQERANGPAPVRTPPPSTLPRITSDQVLLIREAQEILATNQDAAARLHERAKQSLVELGLVAPDARSCPHRRDVLVVWAYLGGKLELDVVSMILSVQGA